MGCTSWIERAWASPCTHGRETRTHDGRWKSEASDRAQENWFWVTGLAEALAAASCHSVPKCKESVYINFQSKISLFWGTER